MHIAPWIHPLTRRDVARARRLARAGHLLTALLLAAVLLGATESSALAETGGVDRTPVMGWSSWSFLRMGVDAQRIEAEARAMVSTGLSRAGYRYVNIDDNWYRCPGPQGPDVDHYGRWVVNAQEFPDRGSVNGIKVVADVVHRLGLRFGIYLTPGISKQAVRRNTRVLGTTYTADQIATKTQENNYNCGGMVGLNYASPGAQAYVDSVVDELASWGVDYVKLDGITNRDVPTIQAWSKAIAQSGRPMVLNITQGSYTIKIAPELDRYANQWEFTPDIEINGPDEGSASACNGPSFIGCLSVFPLTSYAHWSDRFNAVAQWQPFGAPGGFNDYDSIEVGNGVADSGMTIPAQESQLSLWALGAAPLILGGDLSNAVTNAYGSHAGLTPGGLALLTNRRVIAVDQDAIDASRIRDAGATQVFAKTERSGDVVTGLFDTSRDLAASPQIISVTPKALGLVPDHHGYVVTNLWTGRSSTVPDGRAINERVPSEGVALVRVTPAGKG